MDLAARSRVTLFLHWRSAETSGQNSWLVLIGIFSGSTVPAYMSLKFLYLLTTTIHKCVFSQWLFVRFYKFQKSE